MVAMTDFVYCPSVTFEDTNLVGNVYFANFVRWENECRNDWLKATAFDLYDELFRGTKRLVVSELALKFHDPTGARLGNAIEVDMTVASLENGSCHATFEMRRRAEPGSTAVASILATGHQRFAVIDCDAEVVAHTAGADSKEPCGPAYLFEFPIPLDACRRDSRISALDLIRWQGKCRERFLADHSASMLQSVAIGSLALHTSQVSLALLDDVRIVPSDSIRLEMRMTELKSRLTVQFDYYLINGDGERSAVKRIATGMQVLCCKRLNNERILRACVFPPDMLHALRRFTESDRLISCIDVLFAHQAGGAASGSAPVQRVVNHVRG